METLSQKIISWFILNERDLPWRRTYLPYHIWISEIMLQQTQMERVVSYFTRWIQRYPDIASLAVASEDDVLQLWEGLGYYSRARNILQTARLLTSDHGGELPADFKTLLQLPGIGNYTASAIMSIAFQQDYPVIDANVERFFARIFDLDKPVKEKTTFQFIQNKVEELLPIGKARYFNQALMEFGALICQPANPLCTECPLAYCCIAKTNGTVDQRPVPRPKPETVFIEMATGILINNNKIFIQKRPPSGVWANLWEFPGGQMEKEEIPEETVVREFKEETELHVEPVKLVGTVKHSYTRYRVTLHGFICTPKKSNNPVLHAAQQYRWISAEELDLFAFPAGHRKIIDLLRRHDMLTSFLPESTP